MKNELKVLYKKDPKLAIEVAKILGYKIKATSTVKAGFSFEDNLLGSFSFADLIDIMLSNPGSEYNAQTVMNQYKKILNSTLKDSRRVLKNHMKEIINALEEGKLVKK